MSKKQKQAAWAVLLAAVLVLLAHFLMKANIPVLQPAGEVGSKERRLVVYAVLLCMIVVIPVYVMAFFIAIKYREGNKKARYQPSWDHDWRIEALWWAVPIAIISVLGVITWRSSHELDPFRSIDSKVPPMTVQVVALPWKWLFIYPQQDLASVNYLQLPINTPIDFHITSDAPMNSFWIPQLGGQIYAMSGMETQLHLIADKPGVYTGRSANISGRGFSGMQFQVHASDKDEFSSWVAKVKKSKDQLSVQRYTDLAQESENNPVAYYSSAASGLFNDVIMKYMEPGHQMGAPSSNDAMHMEHNFYQ